MMALEQGDDAPSRHRPRATRVRASRPALVAVDDEASSIGRDGLDAVATSSTTPSVHEGGVERQATFDWRTLDRAERWRAAGRLRAAPRQR